MLTEVHVPEDAADAAALIAGSRKPMAGGTSLMPWLNDYASNPTELVSLRKAGLGTIEVDGGHVVLGATVTLLEIEQDERLGFLNKVARSIASVPVRSLATVGGNLFAHQPHGDLAVALVALDAVVTVVDENGTTEVPVEKIVVDGDRGGLVTKVAFDRPREADFKYVKAARRRFNSSALVVVSARMSTDDAGAVTAARVALGGVAPRIVRAHAIEAALIGRSLDEESVAAAAEAGLGEIAPMDDAYSSAWYRNRVFPVHLRRALLGN